MKGIISDHLSLRRMPTGRYVFALTQMRALAQDAPPGLGARIDAALETGRAALREELAWEQARARQSSARGNAVVLDNRIDVHLSAIQSIVQARTVGEPGDPVVRGAEEVLRRLFPRGVAPITRQSFEVQLGIMDTMLDALSDDLASHVVLLGLEREVARFRALVEEFRTELSVVETAPTTFAKLVEARDALHEHTAIVVISILAAWPSLDVRCHDRDRHRSRGGQAKSRAKPPSREESSSSRLGLPAPTSRSTPSSSLRMSSECRHC